MKKHKYFNLLLLMLPIASVTLSACGNDPFEQDYGFKENDPDSVIVAGPVGYKSLDEFVHEEYKEVYLKKESILSKLWWLFTTHRCWSWNAV